MAELIKPIAAHLDQPLSDRDQELISFIRQRFASNKNEQGYVSVKVGTRNSTMWSLSQDEGKESRKNYKRRQELLHNGFFTPAEKTFRSIGEVNLDNVDLFTPCLTTEDQELMRKQLEKRHGKKTGGSVFSQEKAKKFFHQDEKVHKPDENVTVSQGHNGFVYIREYLEELGCIRNSILTGHPLALCLNAQKATSVSSTKKVLPTTAIASDWNAPDTVGSMQYSRAIRASDSEERIFCQKKDHLAEKLEWIYLMMCGITNMKNKDIRSMIPLSAGYLKLILKETEKTAVFPKISQSSHLPANVKKHHRLQSLQADDFTADLWETFIHADSVVPPESGSERRSISTKFAGYKPLMFGPKKRGVKEMDIEGTDFPPWLLLLLDEKTSHDKSQQKPKNKNDVLQRVKSDFLSVQKTMNNHIEARISEKQKNRDIRLKALLNAMTTQKKQASLPSFLFYLKSQVKEPQSCSAFWLGILKNEAAALGETDKRFNVKLEKLSNFYNFSHHSVSYSKEKLCLLTLSLPADKLLRLTFQDALLFLSENIIQLTPKQLKLWYQYRKLPFCAHS